MSLEKATGIATIVLLTTLVLYYATTMMFFKFGFLQSTGLILLLYLSHSLYNLIKIYTSNKILTPSKPDEFVIITGCTNGLGKSLALDLARQGFNLVLISRNQQYLDLLRAEVLQKHYREVICISHNFFDTSETVMKEKLNVINDKFIGVLVNNVGISNDITEEYANYSLSDDYQLIDVNIKAQLMMTKILLPIFIKQKYGYVLNISSGSAYQPCPYISVYGSTKEFFRHWSNALAIECAQYNVKFYVCLPLFFLSNMVKENKSLLVPTSEVVSEAIMRHCLVARESCPYFFHWIQNFVCTYVPIPEFTAKVFTGIYKKRKAEKEQENKENKEKLLKNEKQS